ncbi:DMT family transporter [bacterium]|nr:DMT family transporter [bacterium]
MQTNSRWVYFVPLLAMFAYAWAAILIRYSEEASPFVIAFYRMAVASVVWAPFYWSWDRKRSTTKPTARQWKLIVLAGLMLCLHFATWIASIRYTTVSSAVFLILTQPFMVAIAAHFILHEKLNRFHMVAFVLTFAGAALIFGGDLALSKTHLYGDFLALIGAAAAGAYLFIARLVRSDSGDAPGVPLQKYLPPVFAISAVGLLLLSLVSGQSLGPFEKNTWIALLLLGLVPTVIGHSLLNWSSRYLSALAVNISLVGEPIGASILAYVLLDEIPSTGLLIGSPLLVIAVVLVYLRPPLVRPVPR